MKPILFNTEMVRAILDGRKTATRRPCHIMINGNMTVVHKHCCTVEFPATGKDGLCAQFYDGNYFYQGRSNPTYRLGDILYVRETFCWCPCLDCGMNTEQGCVDETAEKFYNDQKAEWGCYGYKASFADDELPFCDGWNPSIHMPREAARIFLRVTDVMVERLQDISDADARKEGCADLEDFRMVWNDCYAKPRPVKGKDGVITNYKSYPFEDVYGKGEYMGKPWYVIGNPWVLVIEFERISREEAFG